MIILIIFYQFSFFYRNDKRPRNLFAPIESTTSQQACDNDALENSAFENVKELSEDPEDIQNATNLTRN